MESAEGQVADPRLEKVSKTTECVSMSPGPGPAPTGLQLLLEDPLLLQDLVAEEKNRGLDDQIDLNEPVADHQPLRVVGWYRLRLSFALGEIHIRIKQCSEGPVVLVMKLDAFNLTQSTTDIRDVKDLDGIPSYASELLHGQEHTVDYSTGYILLVYNASHGWEMAGFLDPSAPSQSPIEVGGFVSSNECDMLLQTLTEPAAPSAAEKSPGFLSVKVKKEPSNFTDSSENVLPSLLNDDYCSSDDTLPLGSPKNDSFSRFHRVYDLDDFSNSPLTQPFITTPGERSEADLYLPNLPLTCQIKVEKDSASPPKDSTPGSESQPLQEVVDNEVNDVDCKPDPILMFLPNPKESQLTSSPDYPVISIKEEETFETTSITIHPPEKVIGDLDAVIPLDATEHPIREAPAAILIKSEPESAAEQQSPPSGSCSPLVQLRTYKKCPICLKDILEPLYDLHLALHGPVQAQTAIDATQSAYGANKLKKKCPICLDEIFVQLYDMHQALHRSQNLFQSRSTVSDERHSAAATKSNTVETASSSNQVPPLIPIESQSQQPVPSTSSSSTTESDAQNTTDREATKNKLIKQQLVLLLHASKCQKENGINKECTIPPCRTMRSVLAHLPLCRDGDSCKVSHCISSRAIILHWKNCKKLDCIICFPIKQAERKKSETNSSSESLSTFRNPVASSQTSASKSTRAPPALVPLRVTQQHQVIDLTDDTPAVPSSSSTSEAHWNDFKAEPVQASKQWHLTVSSQLRDHLLLKLFKTVLPTIDTQLSPNSQDPRMQKLTSYLRQIEKDLFVMAHSRNNYYQMLAEKIFVIQKELEVKRKQLAAANADLMAHIVVNPVMVLKPWHWSVAPNLRRHLILKFIALVFKEAELPTSNIEHVRKIAAYAASIEVKVFQSTESQNDYNREITKEYSVALAKLKMRKQLRMQQEAASLRTDTTDNVQSQSVGRGTVQQSMGNASSESTSNSYVIPTQTFPVTTYNNVSNSNEYEPEVLYEAPHPQQQIHNRTAEPPPYPSARQQQQQQQKSIDQSSSNYRQQPMSCRVPQPVSQPPNSCSVLQQILERPTSDQYSVNDPHNSQHINKTVTTSNEPTFFSQQQTVPDTYNTHGIFGSFSDGKSVMEEQQQQVGSCSIKLESETDFMQKCNICLKVFGKRKQYEQHMITHDPSQWKRCDRCNFTAPRSSYIRNHAAMAHGDQFSDPMKESETVQQMKRPRLSTDEC